MDRRSMGRPMSKSSYKKLMDKLSDLGVCEEIKKEYGEYMQELLAFDPNTKCSGELLERKITDANKRRERIRAEGKSTYEGARKAYYERTSSLSHQRNAMPKGVISETL